MSISLFFPKFPANRMSIFFLKRTGSVSVQPSPKRDQPVIWREDRPLRVWRKRCNAVPWESWEMQTTVALTFFSGQFSTKQTLTDQNLYCFVKLYVLMDVAVVWLLGKGRIFLGTSRRYEVILFPALSSFIHYRWKSVFQQSDKYTERAITFHANNRCMHWLCLFTFLTSKVSGNKHDVFMHNEISKKSVPS